MKRVMVLLFGGALASGIAAYTAMAKSEPKPAEKQPAVKTGAPR